MLDSRASVLRAEHIEGKHHGGREGGGLLLAGEVETVHLPGITPLVEGGCGLIILQPLYYGVVDHYLLVLYFDPDHAEGVVGCVVVDVDAAEALLSRLDWHPLLTGVIVHHDRGAGLADTLFTEVIKGIHGWQMVSMEEVEVKSFCIRCKVAEITWKGKH